VPVRKPIQFLGDSLKCLRSFPEGARLDSGRELARAQEGHEFRVIHVANTGSQVYVLHAFHKKTQKTARRDIELAAARYRQIKE
jgi:phage-related protein